MFRPTKCLLPYALLLVPGLVDLFPMFGKLLLLVFLLSEGLYLWWKRSPWGARLLSTSVASGWIALASYPLMISKLDDGVLYLLLFTALISPWLFFGLFQPRRVLWLTLTFLLILNTRPGRRFAETPDSPRFQELAASLHSIEEATDWVHRNIERKKGPPTDTAEDTLLRGYGHCGAMNNLLHKLLLAQGCSARIIHLEGNSIHSLVQVGETLADAQENEVRPLKPEHLPGNRDDSLPASWRGHERVWIYTLGSGYRKL